MRHIRARGHRWYIRFYDASRQPKEKTVSLPKDSFSRRQIKQKRDELYARWHNDDPNDDPWRNPDFGKGTRAGGTSGAAGGQESVTAATKTYVEAKRKAGRRGERGGWTEKSLRSRESLLLKFAGEAGGTRRPAAGVTTEHIDDFVYGRPELAQSTRRGYWRKVKAMLRWWEKEGIIEAAPAMPPKPRPDGRLPAFVSVQDLLKICSELDRITERKAEGSHVSEKTAGRDWMKDAFWFAFYQGLRRELVVSVRLRNIDFRRGEIHVGDFETSPKGDRHAVIPLVAEARPIAEKWREGGEPSDRLFRHAGAKKLSDAFRECARAAVPEKPRLSFHKLRNGCAVYWLQRGARLPYVQKLLRHAKIETTRKYLRLVRTDLQAEFERVSIMSE
jgi:integrase